LPFLLLLSPLSYCSSSCLPPFAPQGLVELRSRYGFLLVVDEAHATLVAGAHGGGAAEAAGVVEHIDVHTGWLTQLAWTTGVM
jgi:7-keto-8-aminopelargonate synthetase-like enzyme